MNNKMKKTLDPQCAAPSNQYSLELSTKYQSKTIAGPDTLTYDKDESNAKLYGKHNFATIIASTKPSSISRTNFHNQVQTVDSQPRSLSYNFNNLLKHQTHQRQHTTATTTCLS